MKKWQCFISDFILDLFYGCFVDEFLDVEKMKGNYFEYDFELIACVNMWFS